MIDAKPRPLDTIVHRGGTTIGAFRCATDHEEFRDSGPIQNDILVFPRSSVRIRHEGGPAFVADQTVATIYNRGQIYDRHAVSEEGDRSDWFAIPRDIAIEAVIANGLDPAARGPFSFACAPISARTYLAQRRLFRRAQCGAVDREIDEGVYAILDDVISAASEARGRRPADERSRPNEIADEIRSAIAGRFDEDWPLKRLEMHLGLSTFQLCRAFRKSTGITIHQYLLSLRLHASLERLETPKGDIAALALDLGFSSHSHFALSFTRTFKATPSACRRSLNAVVLTS